MGFLFEQHVMRRMRNLSGWIIIRAICVPIDLGIQIALIETK